MQHSRSCNKLTNSARHNTQDNAFERPAHRQHVSCPSIQARSILKPSPPPVLKRASTSASFGNRPRAASDIRHSAKNQAYTVKTWRATEGQGTQEQIESEKKMRKRMDDLLRFENARREQLRHIETLHEYAQYMDKYSLRAFSRRLQVEGYYRREPAQLALLVGGQPMKRTTCKFA